MSGGAALASCADITVAMAPAAAAALNILPNDDAKTRPPTAMHYRQAYHDDTTLKNDKTALKSGFPQPPKPGSGAFIQKRA